MKNYKRRGCGYLIAAGCTFLIGLIMLANEKTRYVSISLMIMSLVWLPVFFAYRRMTEEQFAERAKKERKQFDERHTQIALRTCRAALLAGFISILAAILYFAFIDPNKAAVLVSYGHLVIMVLAIYIAHAVYSKKM